MPANKMVSLMQMEELVRWMEDHPLQARETQLGTASAEQSMNSLWDQLASHLNAVGDGASKLPKEWRAYWSDCKCKIEKQGSAISHHGGGTGGGAAWGDILTPIEERILALMGVENVAGNPNISIPVDINMLTGDSPTTLVPPMHQSVYVDPAPSSSHPYPHDSDETLASAAAVEPSSPPPTLGPVPTTTPQWLESRQTQREEVQRGELALRREQLEAEERWREEQRTWHRADEQRHRADEERHRADEQRHRADEERQKQFLIVLNKIAEALTKISEK